VLAHLFGGRIYADVAQRLVDTTLNQALADQKVQPLSEPSIAPTELKPDDAFRYKARFEVRPDIEEVKWEGFEVKRPSTAPSDDMIDAEVTRLRREHSTLQAPEPERPAQKGDTVSITFTLEIEGREREPKDQEIETELGQRPGLQGDRGRPHRHVAEREEGRHDELPERHQNAELRGKDALFHITLKDVKERVFPEVDDEFAKDCGQESLEKLRVVAARDHREGSQAEGDERGGRAARDELCKANPIPVPPSLVEQQAQITERELLQRRGGRGSRCSRTPSSGRTSGPTPR
jgi:trigger factor